MLPNANMLGERIRTLRLERNLTQQEVGDVLGVTAQAVSKWETGSAAPDIALLPKISDLFQCTIDSLFQGIEPVADSPEARSAENKRGKPGAYCSFCGKHQSEVWRIIAGPGVDICSECVEMCENILKQMKTKV